MLKTITINTETHRVVPVEMTEEMMREVQMCSEIGAHIISNWSGAYEALRAHYSVEIAAAPAFNESAWQPIENAPRDFCTSFIGFNGDLVFDVSWQHPEYSPKGYCAWCISENDSQGQMNVEVKGLTHWMPNPSAPEGI